MTVRAVILGLILSVVMGSANVYLGLKAGMTVSASIPAAVLAMVFLRGLFRNGTILECNQVQTAASAGESLAAGIIFTMPAMILIGAWQRFDWGLTTIIAFTGGLLGILFMIPMRRVFVITEDPDLKFPEGVACAAVLRAGQENAEKGSALAILQGGVIGAVVKLLAGLVGVVNGTLEGATRLGGRIFYLGTDVSPALLAVGYIVGLNVAILIFIGGAIAWLVGIPLLSGDPASAGEVLDSAWTLWSTKVRYVGVGCMAVGGVSSIWKVRGGLVHAVREMGRKPAASAGATDKDRDLPKSIIVALSMIAVLMVGGVYFHLTGDLRMTLIITAIMIVMSFFFTAVASYIVGLVGNSNSPVSGMTITTVLFTGLLLVVLGFSGTSGMVAVLGVAAIVCCVACTSGDICNDLKTGQLVGASPMRQQLMQIGGVAVACLVMAPVMQLLHEAADGGIGGPELPAPQAALFAGLVRGFFGEGALPWDLVGVGAGLGLLFLVIDRILEWRKTTFRVHLMPVAVGMYLPFGLAAPILIGGLINHAVVRGRNENDAQERSRRGVLFASGAIAGESLMGVGIAVLYRLGIEKMDLQLSDPVLTTTTIVIAVGLVLCFRWFSRPRN
ncbi:MAG: oligopeptide transporter, OPT family [Kiritimatiellia bacterium]|jgi:putative OPT family oligopeptide transporter|nr:oligopeptide transporter, OPT family [Kiritimatiellia bacterium]